MIRHTEKMLTTIVALLLAAQAPALEGRTYTKNGDFDKGTLKLLNHDPPNEDQLQISLHEDPDVDPYLWVANYLLDTVTKVDTRTGRQVGLYHSVLVKNWDGSPVIVSTPGSGCNSPSRTTVDAAGSAFVANRAFCASPDTLPALASVTKFGGRPEQCVDRNGNGQIDTSRDANNDGRIDINSPLEFFGQADECILWTRNYAAPDDWGRSVAIDAEQNVWLGGYHTSKLYKLSNKNGELLRTIDPVAETRIPAKIYGLAIGPKGFIYTSDLNDTGGRPLLQRIDPNALAGTPAVKTIYAPRDVSTYGIAVDKNNIVWLGNWSTYNNGGLLKVNFDAGEKGSAEFMSVPLADCTGQTRGVAVDNKGDVWTACWSKQKLLRFNSAGIFKASYQTEPGPLGVALDKDNMPWTANQNSNTLNRFSFSPDDVVTVASYPAGPVKGDPYSYWDMTGYQHRHFTMREGIWTVVHDSGDKGTTWGSLYWNREAQGSTPDYTRIQMYARASDDPAALASQTFVEVANGTPFTGVAGRHLQVKATLTTQDLITSPVLSDLSVVPQMCWLDVTSTIPGDEETKGGVLKHKAVLLKNGQVLSVGGWNTQVTRLFNPSNNQWKLTARPLQTRLRHTATRLGNGVVLVAGGVSDKVDFRAELYQPADPTKPGSEKWVETGRMNVARADHTATLLLDPRTGGEIDQSLVLVVGGDTSEAAATAEIYNPANGTWTSTTRLNQERRRHHTATRLSTGLVLITGGIGDDGKPLNTAELYNPQTDVWTPVYQKMNAARAEHTATLLTSGRVLVSGGNPRDGTLGVTAEIYDPAQGTWTPTSSMKYPRAMHAAVLLKSGKVLVTGGYNDATPIQKWAELYDPATGAWSPACNMNYTRRRHTMTLLDDNKVLVISGESQDKQGSAELLIP